jgi:DivIVA domain-containing protein
MSRGSQFKRRALKRGYKVDEVDEFLARAEATLAGHPVGEPVTPEDVRHIEFRIRFGGYDEWQVDLHLDRLERELSEVLEGEASRGSNGFPALPPANRDREGRLALLPGKPVAEPLAEPINRVINQQSQHNPDMITDPVPPIPVSTSGSAAVYVSEGSRHGTQYGRPSSASPADETKVHTGLDTFADLEGNDYEDPFADHTPKPSFRENFHSSATFVAPIAEHGEVNGRPSGPIANPTYPNGNTAGVNGFNTAEGHSAPVVDSYPSRHGKVDMTVELPTFGGQVSPFTNEDKAQLAQLRGGFKHRRFGTGYDPSQVDSLFDAMSAAMEGQATTPITAADFEPSQFQLVSGGYFEDEVEKALTQLQALFTRRMPS